MESHDRDQLDDLLESALKHYASAEPRAGLEGRVLARMRAESVIAPRKWIWAAAFVACACMLAAIAVGWQHHSRKPVGIAVQKTQVPPRIDRREEIVAVVPRTRPVHETQTRGKKNSTREIAKAAPRLSQFPSRRPLTQEELVILEYARRFPDEAVLVAQRQQQFEKQVAQAQRQVESRFEENETEER